jgi:hypothetical protein
MLVTSFTWSKIEQIIKELSGDSRQILLRLATATVLDIT